jgi:hypothetical protein
MLKRACRLTGTGTVAYVSSPWQAPTRVDLSERSDFFLDLLEDTRRWRERLVQELQFESGTHVRLVSSYQIDFPRELLERHLDVRRTERANVLVPLTTRPKALLLNFDLAGPGGTSAALTSRTSTAALQAEYLQDLARAANARDVIENSISNALYEAISVFTPGRYERRFLNRNGGDHVQALLDYLRSGLRGVLDPGDLRVYDVLRWRLATERAAGVLLAHLGEPRDPLSCSEELLLALPHLEPRPTSCRDIDGIVADYLTGVLAAHRSGDDAFLTTLAEYGRRYEMVVEIEVPVLEPSTIKITEDLPLEIARGFQSWTAPVIPLGDARSVHVESRVLDAGVAISKFQLCELNGDDAGGWIDSARHTREAVAIYASDPARPYYARLRLRLGVARHIAGATLALALANVAAIIAMSRIAATDYVDRLAILAIPTTVAATVVLVREQTALATRLQWRGVRALLALSLVALWAVVVMHVVDRDQKGDKSRQRPPGARQSADASSNSTYHRTQEAHMAKAGSTGNGRIRAVRDRGQTRDPRTGSWSKRDTTSGRFMDVKRSGDAFKGVRREG